MEFTVKKFDLLQELTLTQGVVERKTTIPILANVLVRADGGELGVVATDLEIGLKSVCPVKMTTPIPASARWRRNGSPHSRSPSTKPPPWKNTISTSRRPSAGALYRQIGRAHV